MWAGAGGMIGGSLIGGALDLAGSAMANAANRQAANRAFRHNVWMLDNRYQRTTQDMIKAGINPIMAAGTAVSAPSGQPMAAPARNILEGFSESAKGFGERLQRSKLLDLERRQKEYETGLTGALWTKAEDEALLARETRRNMEIQQEVSKWVANRTEAEAKLAHAEVPQAQALERLYSTEGGAWLRQAQAVLQAITGISRFGAKR